MAPRARAASKRLVAVIGRVGTSEAAREQIWHLPRAALGQLPYDGPVQALLARIAPLWRPRAARLGSGQQMTQPGLCEAAVIPFRVPVH